MEKSKRKKCSWFFSIERKASRRFDGLDIMICRSQGNDNASIMAGIHGGLQARIKDVNKKALFNGCGSHSLNLCGQHSFAENASCVS